jgi:hypothetical protein
MSGRFSNEGLTNQAAGKIKQCLMWQAWECLKNGKTVMNPAINSRI